MPSPPAGGAAAARGGSAAGGAGAAPNARFSSSRPIGPRRYDSVHRVSNTTGSLSWTLCIRNTRFFSEDSVLSSVDRSRPLVTPSRPSSTRPLSRSVCSLPRNQVPVFDSAL